MLPIQRVGSLLMCHAFSAHHGCKPLADGLTPLPELIASKLATPHEDAVWQEVDMITTILPPSLLM